MTFLLSQPLPNNKQKIVPCTLLQGRLVGGKMRSQSTTSGSSSKMTIILKKEQVNKHPSRLMGMGHPANIAKYFFMMPLELLPAAVAAAASKGNMLI